MATVTRFEDLEIWRLARELYILILPITVAMKKNQDFRFAQQLKSAAGSIMDNIAEGFERTSRLEFINSLSIARGESGEVKSQLYRAMDDAYLDTSNFNLYYQKADTLSRKIGSFIKYLNGSSWRGQKFKDRRSLD